MNLEETIQKCASGDRKAQTTLYNQFASKMYGVCLRYSKDSTEAEDNLQDGFIRVFTKINQFGFKGSFEGWMRRIMVNTSLEKFRKNNHLYAVEDMVVYENVQIAEETISAISADDLLKIVQGLPPRYRMVFNLYAIEGYSHQEIASLMSITEGTSKSNLSRARVILQKKVIDEFGLEKNTVTTTLC
ncbi:MAG: RNA polymerase sigma factor [Bacteroidia bacterium]|nr:RNA polymerase sigma factor [Bacteroidia bacterium]